MAFQGGRVESVNKSGTHSFTKSPQPSIQLLAGLGVEGDAHMGVYLQHLSRKDQPPKPNLRQVSLIHAELFEEVAQMGFAVKPGDIGENVTTRGIDLLGLPTGARLRLGKTAVVEVTGLRNPCRQIDDFQQGLMSAVLDRDADGNLIRKSGVMSVVVASGEVSPGDEIVVELPQEPHTPLAPV